jgi:MmgE/PrpD N-terminal domain
MMGRGEQVQEHLVRVYKSAETPGRADQLAWKLAAVASDNAALDPDVVGMILNRVIDNAGVAVASLLRRPVANARAQAVAHPHAGGSTLFGASRSNLVACEWGGWANGTAVRELDFHDTVVDRLEIIEPQQVGKFASIDLVAFVAMFSSAFLRGLHTTNLATCGLSRS